MIYSYQPKFFKIILIVIALIFIHLILGFSLLLPYRAELQHLLQINRFLEKQYHDQKPLQKNFDNLKIKFSSLQKSWLSDIEKIKKTPTINRFYQQISSMTRAYHLKLMELKPQQNSLTGSLQKQTFHLEIDGTEKSIWLFLNSISQYRSMIEFIQIELMKNPAGVNLQAMLAVYYDAMV